MKQITNYHNFKYDLINAKKNGRYNVLFVSSLRSILFYACRERIVVLLGRLLALMCRP